MSAMLSDTEIDALATEGAANDPAEGSKPKSKQSREPIIDERHPFDLDSYISNYSGRTVVTRLLFIAKTSPTLAPAAYNLAIQQLLQSRDVSTYSSTVSAYNALPSVTSKIVPNRKWIEETTSRNTSERERLEVELKTYTSNMIKESVRMGHRDLGHYYRSVADFQTALRHYQKTREFCSNGQQVLEHCLSVLEVLIEQNNYAQISTFVFKAESALDIPGPQAAGKKPATGTAPAPTPDKERIQTKLELCGALANMYQGNYDTAAYGFLKLKRDLSDWQGKIISPGDIAVYGTLCALASFKRSAIKTSIIESDTFGYYLEQEPHIRELLDAFLGSRFKTVLELLDKYSTRHILDLHLSNHVLELHRLIRNRSLVLYFQPFTTVRLEKMATAFGINLPELEALIVTLIRDGQIKGRIDSQNKTLNAKDTDERVELFTRAIKTGADTQDNTRKLLLRMKLLQADLIVKPPKAQQPEAGQIMD